MKLKLIIIAIAAITTSFASAQSYIQKTSEQIVAESIQQSAQELGNHIEVTLVRLYAVVNTKGKQQEILDALGTNAAKALADYAAMRQAIITIKGETKAPEPDPTVFVAKPDGTVTYVAPPEEE